MEKYSAFRDPGTGIQPFLPPVHPQGFESCAATILKPAAYILGAIRTLLVLALVITYIVVVRGVCILLSPVPPLYRVVSYYTTAIILRLILFTVGLYWIPVEVVKRKRGRASIKEVWNPKAGDVIISNWISWLEIAWVALRYNALFVLPVTAPVENTSSPGPSSPGVTSGRKIGLGVAAVTVHSREHTPTKRADILGFTEISLMRMIMICGCVPPYGLARAGMSPLSFSEVITRAKKTGRPIALYPECTTSNGRGLLRFSNLLKNIPVPVKNFNVFIMCARVDPPTALSPTLSIPIPSSRQVFNPIPHIFSVSSSIMPHTLSVRLLAPSQSPSSASFLISEVLSGNTGGDDVFSEVCATLMTELGRLKRTGMGWEDKTMFLEFYRGKDGR
ncbi:hypothetical protein EW145_g637 [Phellinidium pouzarii]|uniref:Phospholipid/glycerol acyltransferase domain-containing protein n=1 Tax=Phellinidium pouzarii TaxID=167371 RepID=A0A4S4LHM2_9AGAM|nr:hypothetical protein EW145_g637 [Phellinidium pouzarii]